MVDWITTVGARAFAYLLFLPFAVGLVIRAAAIAKDDYGRWGGQWILIFLGFYLCFWQGLLYVFQYALVMMRPNPFDPTSIYYGVPSEIGFHTAAFVTFIVEFTLVWNIQFSVFYWAELILMGVVPASILIWSGFNSWQEVLLSMGLGVGAITIFIIIVRVYLRDQLPFILNTAPWTWFSCIDTYVQTKEGREQTEHVRTCMEQIERQLPRRTGLGWLLHRLY
jgi:hypothetical protein